jgi:hypothetical protein
VTAALAALASENTLLELFARSARIYADRNAVVDEVRRDTHCEVARDDERV